MAFGNTAYSQLLLNRNVVTAALTAKFEINARDLKSIPKPAKEQSCNAMSYLDAELQASGAYAFRNLHLESTTRLLVLSLA